MFTTPTCETSGHDGEDCSSAPSPSPLRAAAAGPSEQYGTPASFPSRPSGRLAVIAPRRWLPSSRETLNTNGENAPATGASVPACKLGLFGSCASLDAHAPPFAPEPMLKLAERSVGTPGLENGYSLT